MGDDYQIIARQVEQLFDEKLGIPIQILVVQNEMTKKYRVTVMTHTGLTWSIDAVSRNEVEHIIIGMYVAAGLISRV